MFLLKKSKSKSFGSVSREIVANHLDASHGFILFYHKTSLSQCPDLIFTIIKQVFNILLHDVLQLNKFWISKLPLGRVGREIVANHLDAGLLIKGGGKVGRHLHANNLDSL